MCEAALVPVLVSVVMSAFGRTPLLTEAVDSVLAQTVDDLECIVVDDASPEPLTLPHHPKVRLIRRSVNGGAAAGRNTGMTEARGRFITFMDDDDLYTPDRLEIGLTEVQTPFVLCGLGDSIDATEAKGRRLEGWEGDTILDTFTPHIGQLTAERSRLPLFDTRFRACEDIEWWLRVAQLGDFTMIDRPGYIFREHDGPRFGNGTVVRVKERAEILELHAEWFAAHPRARAFHLRRIGEQANGVGMHRRARSALVRSMLIRPNPHTARHLVASLRPDRPLTASE